MAYRLAARLGGRAAGIVAVACLALADLFVSFFARGNSEGLLVGLVLWAIERHLDGRPRDAFLLGTACALLRPEVWPFIAVYGLWLMLASRAGRAPAGRSRSCSASGAAVALLWFVPEYLGSGNLLRAASRALEPVPDSPAQAARPFLAVFENSSSALWPPAYAGAVVAVVLALERVRRDPAAVVVLALAAGSTLLMLEVAVLAEIGFTGNLRYVALPSALVCVLAGVGWAWLVALVRERRGAGAAVAAAAVLLAAAIPFALHTVPRVADQLRDAQARDGPGRRPAGRDRRGRRAGRRSCAAGRPGPAPSRRSSSPGTCALHQREVGPPPGPPGHAARRARVGARPRAGLPHARRLAPVGRAGLLLTPNCVAITPGNRGRSHRFADQRAAAGRRDGDLAEGDAAVVGREPLRDEHPQAGRLQRRRRALQQAPVLEDAAGEHGGVEPAPPRDLRAGGRRRRGQRRVEARGDHGDRRRPPRRRPARRRIVSRGSSTSGSPPSPTG